MKWTLIPSVSRPRSPAAPRGRSTALWFCRGGVLLAAVACGQSPGADLPSSRPAEDVGVAAAAGQWSREALEAQPRMDLLVRTAPPELGYTPATTPWRAIAWTPAAAPDPLAGDSPGFVLSRLAASLGWSDGLGDAVWEQTIRVWPLDTGQATGIVLLWGFLDDAVAGRDFRVHLRRTGEGWTAEAIEERFHCARRVTEDGSCA